MEPGLCRLLSSYTIPFYRIVRGAILSIELQGLRRHELKDVAAICCVMVSRLVSVFFIPVVLIMKNDRAT